MTAVSASVAKKQQIAIFIVYFTIYVHMLNILAPKFISLRY